MSRAGYFLAHAERISPKKSLWLVPPTDMAAELRGAVRAVVRLRSAWVLPVFEGSYRSVTPRCH
jgi:hypothetical protein